MGYLIVGKVRGEYEAQSEWCTEIGTLLQRTGGWGQAIVEVTANNVWLPIYSYAHGEWVKLHH